MGADWTIIAFNEAAQNAATQSNIAPVSEPGLVQTSGDTFEALRDLIIFYSYLFGDSTDIIRGALEGSFLDGRTLDFRSGGIETGHDVPTGILDMRYNPVFWPKGETLEAKFSEDKSTNVEASMLVWITRNPYALSWAKQVRRYKEILHLTLTGGSTTALVWFNSTKTLNDNQDSRLLDPNATYEVIGAIDGIGGSGIKAARLVFPDSIWRPGFKVPEDLIDHPIPTWVQDFPSPRPTFQGDAEPYMETLDTDGSLTPIVVWRVGKL